jgi:hypothetical protein
MQSALSYMRDVNYEYVSLFGIGWMEDSFI